jgi:hypothetical protein
MLKAQSRAKKEQPVRVNVKLAPGTDRHHTVQVLSKVPGVRTVEQTFPGENDQELATLYIVETDASHAKSVLQKLRRRPDVEYVERPASRRLV